MGGQVNEEQSLRQKLEAEYALREKTLPDLIARSMRTTLSPIRSVDSVLV